MEHAPKEAGREGILTTSSWFSLGEKGTELREGVRKTGLQSDGFVEEPETVYLGSLSLL